jgi:phosphatidylserine/phosphatidylglycerophosphate/cardiolipin synthase-like enzyme
MGARQFGGDHAAQLLQKLISTPGIEIRVKHAGAPLMHLKSYQIDGRWLRTGAANFSASGLKRQDNDLLVIDNQTAAAAFERRFDAMFAQGQPLNSAVEEQFP